MGRLFGLVTPSHKKTKRKYLNRMVDDKVHCMLKAREGGLDVPLSGLSYYINNLSAEFY